MLTVLLLSVICATGNDALSQRVQTLAKHVERLEAIEVPAELQSEKQAKLAELRTRLEQGAADEATFQALYVSIDDLRMWLWKHAAERPVMAKGTFEESTDEWRIKTPELDVRIQRQGLGMEVRTHAASWRFQGSAADDVTFADGSVSLAGANRISAVPFMTGYSAGCVVACEEFPDRPGLTFRWTLSVIGNEVVMDLAAQDGGPVLNCVRWPRAIQLGNAGTDLTVLPRMQGMLVPGNWQQAISGEDLTNSRSFYLPWWGQIHDGHGVQAILETSADAGGRYVHPAGGPTTVEPIWYASLGKFRYLRTIRYVFDDTATYVTMAKRFRRFVQERGDFVSLRDKLARTPALDQVIGKPVVHLGAMYHFVREAQLYNKERIEANHSLNTFDELADGLRQLKAQGIAHAYVHLDGWGFYGYDNGHPDVLPVGQEQGGWEGLKRFANVCEELGYLFAVHDQYRDFYLNAVSFDDRLAVTRLDGSREQHSVWCGGPQTILSPRFAPEYVRRNHDQFAAHGVKVRGAYLDVFSVVPLEESAQSGCPVTRSECAEYRRDCFDLLRARGYVVSSEEPADYLVRSLDLVHHAPYSTSPNIGGGAATGIPVPLFNLVYHDSLLQPWDMGEDGGWGIPNGDAGRLHCLLNAGLPYVSPGASAQQIDRVQEAAELARRCGTLEMVKHEFLDDGWRLQRTSFSDGTTVTVNFAAKEYDIAYGAQQ
ncbi:MAG: hypothetical protein FJ276_13120 [Planctomycetes bacterium]|nr:hypothetical protein [Planctomycetota bacterium]